MRCFGTIRRDSNNDLLEECGQELAKYLVYFPETYEIEDFRQLQQDALQALIVGAPDVVTG